MDLQVARHEGFDPNRQIRRRLNAVRPVGSSGIYPAHKVAPSIAASPDRPARIVWIIIESVRDAPCALTSTGPDHVRATGGVWSGTCISPIFRTVETNPPREEASWFLTHRKRL
jgi:hypothetical protein